MKKFDFRGKHFLSLADYSSNEIMFLLDRAKTLKQQYYKKGTTPPILKGKALGMIFQKPSTRTRISFEVGMYQLGGHALFLSSTDMQLKRGETIADTARVLSRYVDGIIARVFAHQDVVDLAKYGSIPIINALSDYSHPCQGMADYLTILEKKKKVKGVKVVYAGDGNNVAHSLIYGAAKLGSHIVVATPKGYEPNKEVVERAKSDAKKTGAIIEVSNNPIEAAKNADVIYTDVWASMGQEAEHEKRVGIFMPYQINRNLMNQAKNDVIIMHCLPAHRDEEITDEAIESKNSVVFDQAENRLHAQKAILSELMK
jgi:ornithine carbamoyltransferase